MLQTICKVLFIMLKCFKTASRRQISALFILGMLSLCVDNVYLKGDHVSYLVISRYPTASFERVVDQAEFKSTLVLLETTW